MDGLLAPVTSNRSAFRADWVGEIVQKCPVIGGESTFRQERNVMRELRPLLLRLIGTAVHVAQLARLYQ
jgi:hypothetical protein